MDLPCIIESQKTLDHKHFVKVADICQMIRISRPPPPSPSIPDPIAHFFAQNVPPEAYVENSGITPPLKHCRIRRFRKRVNKRTVESIEREVARLLREDARAIQVQSQLMDPTELEEYFSKQDEVMLPGAEDQAEELDDPRSESVLEEMDEDIEMENEFSKAFADMSSDEEDEEEDEEEEDELNMANDAEEEYEDDFDELRPYLEQQKMIREELRDLEEKIAEKTGQRDKSVNALIKVNKIHVVMNVLMSCRNASRISSASSTMKCSSSSPNTKTSNPRLKTCVRCKVNKKRNWPKMISTMKIWTWIWRAKTTTTKCTMMKRLATKTSTSRTRSRRHKTRDTSAIKETWD